MSNLCGFEAAIGAMKAGRTVYKLDYPLIFYTMNEPLRQFLKSTPYCEGRKSEVHSFDYEDIIYLRWTII